MYNILTDAYLSNTSSGVGYVSQSLSLDQLSDLAAQTSSVTIPAGHYVGIDAQFGMDIVCTEVCIFIPAATDLKLIQYSEFLQNVWVSDGANNYNTGYSTPQMSSNVDPMPYETQATTEFGSSPWYGAWNAFTQTNIDQTDCWLTAYSGGAPPQSLVFYFPYPKVITKYAIQARGASNFSNRFFPQYFVLEGNIVSSPNINDDSHWLTLDTRSGVADPGSAGWSPYFIFSNAAAYRYYRLKVTGVTAGAGNVAVANLKLVEANRPESVPQSVWHTAVPTWNGSYYSYIFPTNDGVERVQFFIGGSRPTTISGIDLYTADQIVVASGIVASGIYTDNFSLGVYTLNPYVIQIQNNMAGNAFPRAAFQYTGNYDVDRNIFLSPDYLRCADPATATWYGIDYGYTVPELNAFEEGVFINTRVNRRQVTLSGAAVSGSWCSPVLDTHNESVAAYMYTLGNPVCYVRAAETPPPLVNFLIVTTNPTEQDLMYDHKRVYLDSAGSVIGQNVCGSDGYKIWRWAEDTWAGLPLMYYGSINALGTASFLVPGYIACDQIVPDAVFNNSAYWYNLTSCRLADSSQWLIGTSVSGIPYGTQETAIFTKTFPVPATNGFFCFSVVSNANTQMTGVNLSFIEDGITRGTFPLISIPRVVAPGDRVDVAYDQGESSWWVYLGTESSLYKVDIGSINNMRIFGAISGSLVNTDEMLGYIWSVPINEVWKNIVSAPFNERYFWAFDSNELYLYEEAYDATPVDIILRNTITQGSQINWQFTELHWGSCDAGGNIWMLDLTQELVFRVDLRKALEGDPLAVDYENQIAGVISLWAHPTDGTCYLLISNEPEYPNQDIIRKVHASQPWGSQGQYICSVPGFCSAPFKYGVSFTGIAFPQGVIPQSNDTIWGLNDNVPWYEYVSDGRWMPRGRYKQLRVDFTRDDSSLPSPVLQRIRLPQPLELVPLSQGQTTEVALKSTFNNVSLPGSWDAKLKIWWFNEEI